VIVQGEDVLFVNKKNQKNFEFLGIAFESGFASELQKFFAELFFKKATAFL